MGVVISCPCSRIGSNLEETLPSLETLVLTNNNIEDFVSLLVLMRSLSQSCLALTQSDLEQLATIKTLTYLR